MSLGVCSGLTQGFSILIAQQYGAKNVREMKRSLAVSLVLSLAAVAQRRREKGLKLNHPEAVAVITALAVWNDVMTPLIIMSGKGQNTLPLAQLTFQTQFGTNYNLAFASYLLALIPIIIFYVICQKQIINGVVNGAVK